MPDEQGNRDCLFLKKRGNPGNNHTKRGTGHATNPSLIV